MANLNIDMDESVESSSHKSDKNEMTDDENDAQIPEFIVERVNSNVTDIWNVIKMEMKHVFKHTYFCRFRFFGCRFLDLFFFSISKAVQMQLK